MSTSSTPTLTSHKHALFQAMLLTITAPNDKECDRATALMFDFAAMVSDSDVKDCQAEVERLVATGLAEAALHANSELLAT